MSQVCSFRLSEITTRPVVPSLNSPAKAFKTAEAKLSAIWVKEFDGEREYFVARWVKQD